MIQIGDRVSHIGFPPVDGIVMGAVPILNSAPKISVQRDDGSIYWDLISNFEIINSDQSNQQESYIDSDCEIIDADFREVT